MSESSSDNTHRGGHPLDGGHSVLHMMEIPELPLTRGERRDSASSRWERWQPWLLVAFGAFVIVLLTQLSAPVGPFISHVVTSKSETDDCKRQPKQAKRGALMAIALSRLGKDDGTQTKHIWDGLAGTLRLVRNEIELVRVCESLTDQVVHTSAEWEAIATAGRKWLQNARADLLIWGVKKNEQSFAFRSLATREEDEAGIDKNYSLTSEMNFSEPLNIVIEKMIVTRIERIVHELAAGRIMYPDLDVQPSSSKLAELDRLYRQVEHVSEHFVMREGSSKCQINLDLGRLALSRSIYSPAATFNAAAGEAEHNFDKLFDGAAQCRTDFIVRVHHYRGDTYMVLASRSAPDQKTKHYNNATSAYRLAVVGGWQRHKDRLSWAISQHNLGAALRNLGQCTKDNEKLKDAASAFREAADMFHRLGETESLRQKAAKQQSEEVEKCLREGAQPPQIRTPVTGPMATPVASTAPRERISTLTCRVSAIGESFFAYQAQVGCDYRTPQGRIQKYYGTIRSGGVPRTSAAKSQIVWDVQRDFAAPSGSLAGSYFHKNVEALGVDRRVFVSAPGGVVLRPRNYSRSLGPSFVLGAESLYLSAEPSAFP